MDCKTLIITSLIESSHLHTTPMAQLCSTSLVFTAIVLLSSHHASSFVPPLSASTITFLSKHNNGTDQQALLSFKSMISSDPRGLLASWNDSIHFCQWLGVTCSGRRHPQRVVSLNLSSLHLAGFISPAISNLTFLREIDLSDNQIHGSIPQEFGHLAQLQHLNLGMNSLEGGIPAALCHCSKLEVIHLKYNRLQGEIPHDLGNCSNLQILSLKDNSLIGHIPPSLAILSSLSFLSLSHNKLSGGIPPTIENLTSLTELFLYNNELTGNIPPSLGNLSSLVSLDLSFNNLTGVIPLSLGNLTSLTVLYLSLNELIGNIPPSLGNLSSLSTLYLSRNILSGGIPPTIGNLFSLTFLSLDHNQLSGRIPLSLGNLSKLKKLYLSANNLSGVIPPLLWNISSLSHLIMSFNYYLSGSLPPNIGQSLPLLESFYIATNQFHGPIPMSLSNASRLEYLELSDNEFSGTIPPNLGSLEKLQIVRMFKNHLEATKPDEWSFLTSLANCTHLEVLQIDLNSLSGMLPNSIANLSTKLQVLTMGGNYISGKISPEIGNLVNLTVIVMGPNLLTGSIPSSIGLLQNLHVLDLSFNNLSREIPFTIGNLTQLISLYLNFNELRGNIPSSLGKCQNLELLNLKSNKLTGVIPKEVLTISTLSRGLYLESNALTGLIPAEIGKLINLGIINLSMNKLSGEIPSAFSECQVLEELYLGGNFLRGNIPTSFGSLRGIGKLDISRNNLSGKIPEFLQDFHGLYYLNLSFNNFEGEVPKLGVFKNASAVSVVGNNKLCGGNPEMYLPVCPYQSLSKKHNSHALVLIIAIASSFLFLIAFFCFLGGRYWINSARRKPHDSTPIGEQYEKVSFAELVKATNRFSTENIIGTGSFGTIYKGILNEDSRKVVAVKVLNPETRGASKSFLAECEALRNIRHRNLVKILTTCSSIDFRGNDFKAVIFEYMENGSLDTWLYPENDQFAPRILNLWQRLNIAIDVASALDYLHHQSEKPVIHSDLKPSNILLDAEMTAHVGDFGLAKVVNKIASKSSQYSTSSFGLKGTIGYIAPEYGVANKVSTHGDVYSYGILLMEMFTAKRPTDDTFADLSLRKFVEMAFPERIKDIIDSHLLIREDGEVNDGEARKIDCIASVLRTGILCSNELPAERMEMGDVIRELHKAKDVLLRN